MNAVTLVAWWFWRTGQFKRHGGFPAVRSLLLLLVITITCRSTGATFLISPSPFWYSSFLCGPERNGRCGDCFVRRASFTTLSASRTSGRAVRSRTGEVNQRSSCGIARFPPRQRRPADRQGNAKTDSLAGAGGAGTSFTKSFTIIRAGTSPSSTDSGSSCLVRPDALV